MSPATTSAVFVTSAGTSPEHVYTRTSPTPRMSSRGAPVCCSIGRQLSSFTTGLKSGVSPVFVTVTVQITAPPGRTSADETDFWRSIDGSMTMTSAGSVADTGGPIWLPRTGVPVTWAVFWRTAGVLDGAGLETVVVHSYDQSSPGCSVPSP